MTIVKTPPSRLLLTALFLSTTLDASAQRVGHDSHGRTHTPVNQIVEPLGDQIDLPGMRPLAVAVSPDGQLLAVSGKTCELMILDAMTGETKQLIRMPGNQPPQDGVVPTDEKAQISFCGLLFAPDGKRIYLSDVQGSIKVFSVTKEGSVAAVAGWMLPPANAPRRVAEIPSGLAISEDGKRLYVVGNLSNRLLELDAASGDVIRVFDVGVAPYDVRLVRNKAYVSNWGGRRPGETDLTGPAGRGTVVRVDPVRHIANEGSVSVIDLAAGRVTAEVVAGPHASGLAVAPGGRWVVVCNANADTLSVIDTSNDKVVAKLWSKPKPSDLIGAAPNAAAFDAAGRRLYVANGSQNAIAVFDFDGDEPDESRLIGMIPVGWYPGAVAVDAPRDCLVVANVKGLPRAKRPHGGVPNAEGFNTHHYSGSLSLIPIPNDDALPALSERVAKNLRAPRIQRALLPPRSNQPPRAIPERVGEPSPIKHVVYIIKENRTYDQVLGDDPRGEGDPDLCVFGSKVTPNHHKLARDFTLLDNTYCCGILSADGHQWSTSAYATDYMEKSFAGFPRSYPDGMGPDDRDALAYSPAGFLWDNAIAHGRTIRNYGEFMMPEVRFRGKGRLGRPSFRDCYDAWANKTDDVVFGSEPTIESIRPISASGYVGWNMAVPDQWRADFVLAELAAYEKRGEFPNLVLICLPQDHTSGTSPGWPTPAACVADNDLAMGRLIEAFSHSQFWPYMAVFVIEDDPQDGWDHVSGYRTVAHCASPYAKRGGVVSEQYNTTSVLRTIEQIMGLPPMNQFDASAEPMFECFTDTPDLRPYDAEPARVRLDAMNPPPHAISDPRLRADAIASSELNFEEVDRAPEDVLNRILWRAMRGTDSAYPAWAAGLDDDD